MRAAHEDLRARFVLESGSCQCLLKTFIGQSFPSIGKHYETNILPNSPTQRLLAAGTAGGRDHFGNYCFHHDNAAHQLDRHGQRKDLLPQSGADQFGTRTLCCGDRQFCYRNWRCRYRRVFPRRDTGLRSHECCLLVERDHSPRRKSHERQQPLAAR